MVALKVGTITLTPISRNGRAFPAIFRLSRISRGTSGAVPISWAPNTSAVSGSTVQQTETRLCRRSHSCEQSVPSSKLSAHTGISSALLSSNVLRGPQKHFPSRRDPGLPRRFRSNAPGYGIRFQQVLPPLELDLPDQTALSGTVRPCKTVRTGTLQAAVSSNSRITR